MDKTSQKVTKDPRRAEAVREGREKYMNKLKENILNDAKKGSEDTSNASNETTSATNTATTPATSTTSTATTPATSTTSSATTPATSTTSTANTRSNDSYVYGVGILAVLAIDVCVFFAYNTSQAANKKQVDLPPKRRHMF